MHRVDTEGHNTGLFQDGTPQTGQQGTILSEDWLNDLQENVCGVIEVGAAMALAKGNYTQLRLAIANMIAGSVVDWTGAIAAAQAAAIAAARVRPGVVEMFGAAAVPAGYLECNGAAVSRATYADLFAAVGTAHGVGDGATTFNVPDLRGEFVRGWDNGRGADAARTFGSAQADAFKAHVHAVTPPASTDDAAAGLTTTGSGGVETITPYNTASTGGTETRPRNVALMFIIKT